MVKLNNLTRIVFLFVVVSFLCSCVTKKEINYFQRADTTQSPLLKPYEPVIQASDRIGILVTSVDKKATNFFTFSLNDNSSNAPSYLVNSEGVVDVPLIGQVHIAGLTTNIAKDTLKKLIERYVNNPTVIVVLKTFRVIVLGAVGSVGILESDHERMTIVEAIARSGDVNFNARRDNIMIIREKGNGKEYGSVDLTSKEIFTSPYYNLHANDIVYVEPGVRTRLAANSVYFSTINIAISFVTLALVYLKLK